MSDFYFEIKKPKERDNLDLLEMICSTLQELNYPSKEMHDAYIEARQELEKRLSPTTPLSQPEQSAEWFSVKERPLFTKDEKGYWTCTKDGDTEFIAAVQYNDNTQPGKTFWWIHHCVIEDETGLCVVGEDGNEPAGWQLEDVEYWKPVYKNKPLSTPSTSQPQERLGIIPHGEAEQFRQHFEKVDIEKLKAAEKKLQELRSESTPDESVGQENAEEVLQKHWPHEDRGSHHENDIINAMHEYASQFKSPSVKEDEYEKLLRDAYEWWEYGISTDENKRLIKKYYPNEKTGYPRFFMDTDKLKIYCTEKNIPLPNQAIKEDLVDREKDKK